MIFQSSVAHIVILLCIDGCISQLNSNGFWPNQRQAPPRGEQNQVNRPPDREEPAPSRPGSFYKQRLEREQLYEAYNLLHTLAQVTILLLKFT